MKKLVFILSLIVIGSSGLAYYFYRDASLGAADSEEAQSLVAEVGRLIVLPTEEEPTIATVSEPERLQDQAFFANAKKGYKVLIYANAKKAILYDPFSQKIVEVAPINIGAEDN